MPCVMAVLMVAVAVRVLMVAVAVRVVMGAVGVLMVAVAVRMSMMAVMIMPLFIMTVNAVTMLMLRFTFFVTIQIHNIVIMVMIFLFQNHIKITAIQSRLLYPANLNRESIKRQCSKLPRKFFFICSHIQERSHCHIPADSVITFKIN